MNNHPYPTAQPAQQPPCLANPNLWQPDTDNDTRYTPNHPGIIKACKSCTNCPRLRQCAAEALQNPHNTGVWASVFIPRNHTGRKRALDKLATIAAQHI